MWLITLVLWSISCSISGVYGVAQIRLDRQVSIGHGPRILSFSDTIPKPHTKLQPALVITQWLAAEGFKDGYHAKLSNRSDLVAEHVASGHQRVLLEASKVPKGTSGFAFNSDVSQVLWAANRTQGWRHSFTANYFVQDMKTGTIRPLLDDQNSDIQVAMWNPRKPSNLLFIRKNNIFLWDNGKTTQVTNNGSPVIFNGVADWVYEEEVIGSRTVWFSPDGEYFAFLSFDDSNVPIHAVPLFMRSKPKTVSLYPREVNIRYPKPGFPNPFVSASVVKVGNPSDIQAVPLDTAFLKDNIVVGEVAWVTDTHDSVIFRCFNRIQNHDKHLLFDVKTRTAKVVRERAAKDGWIDNTRAIQYVGKLPATGGKDQDYYLDLSDMDGWNHVYLFNVQGNKSRQLTSGEWEVNSIRGVNPANNTVFFLASESHPTEQHLFQVSMINRQQKQLVESSSAYWSASFSPNASYYVLNYEGPQVPYQELYASNQTGKPVRSVKDNIAVYNSLRTYQLPSQKYLDLPHPSGFNLSARLTFPPNFDANKKYPVLLTPYGGPGSQEVKKKFIAPGPSSFITANHELGYVTFAVDNRGTGRRGRAFRNQYYKNAGVVDPEDQIWAASWLIKNNPWVDADRVGIWGWSNGGYLSAKVVELDTQGVISFAIATAPTSDFRLYDSIYSERYLGSLQDNKAVYDRASIRNATNFKNIAGGVLLQHGTADDNVHFAHTVAIVELLMSAGVPPQKLRSQFFPDSDHNIAFENQQVFLFRQLALMLMEQKIRVIHPKIQYAWDSYDFESRMDEELHIGPMSEMHNVLLDRDEEEDMSLGGSFFG